MIFLVAAGLLVGGAAIAYDQTKVDNYWEYEGFRDYFRMPLEKPYELVMIDEIDNASIEVWKDNFDIDISDITHYEKRGFVIFGKCHKSSFDGKDWHKTKRWFVFDLKSGEKSFFDTQLELFIALQKMEIEDIQLRTVEENWHAYWKSPRKEKNEEVIGMGK